MAPNADLRFELFPDDLERFRDFYTRVLRFEVLADRRDEDGPYLYLRRGNVRIGVVPAWGKVEPLVRSPPHGVEIVIEVDDLVAERDAITATGYPLTEDIVERPWGLADFRLHDPDGYYLRFTTRA